MNPKVKAWLRGLLAGLISGAANGVITGFAAIGIKPDVFNLGAGLKYTLAIGGIAALLQAILGMALFLQKSPLPEPWDGRTERRGTV